MDEKNKLKEVFGAYSESDSKDERTAQDIMDETRDLKEFVESFTKHYDEPRISVYGSAQKNFDKLRELVDKTNDSELLHSLHAGDTKTKVYAFRVLNRIIDKKYAQLLKK